MYAICVIPCEGEMYAICSARYREMHAISDVPCGGRCMLYVMSPVEERYTLYVVAPVEERCMWCPLCRIDVRYMWCPLWRRDECGVRCGGEMYVVSAVGKRYTLYVVSPVETGKDRSEMLPITIIK